MSKITQIVESLAEPIVQKNGCELWGVEYVKEAGSRYLRVFIDKEGGVSIDNCEQISLELDPLLDEHESDFPENYIFEVSSAGAERLLRGPGDYGRFAGRLAELKLYKARDGRKTYLGILAPAGDGGAEIDISGEKHTFEKSEIASVRLRISGFTGQIAADVT